MPGTALEGRSREDKRMTLKDAIAHYVDDGDVIAFSGMGGEQCVAQTYELIRQGKRDLTLMGDSPCEAADMLIGAGLVKKVEVAWIGYAVAGLAANFRRAVEEGIPRRIVVEEYSNYTMGLRFLAGAIGIPFMPTRSLAGSDLPTYNKRISSVTDPYSGRQVTCVPAARPDVSIVHVHRCDKRGNAQMLSFSSNLENIGRASRKTIVTCEEIVSTDEIRRNGNLTILPEYCVDAVVEIPFACHPWNMPYAYTYDLPYHMRYMEQLESRDGFTKWLDEWVFGCESHEEYCEKVGWSRLFELQRIEKKFCRFGS
jgi:glutaconate CoA-transferase subunit A